jgi:hypothetical protein
LQLRLALALGTVFLMIAKTNHRNALLVMGVVTAGGLLAQVIPAAGNQNEKNVPDLNRE